MPPKVLAHAEEYYNRMREVGKTPNVITVTEAQARALRLYTRYLRNRKIEVINGYNARECRYKGCPIQVQGRTHSYAFQGTPQQIRQAQSISTLTLSRRPFFTALRIFFFQESL